ncbi:MAG: hypothetical protein KIT68_07220 [Phycisphaeraceae bacterium]|nr:hypothetical protein [Phycisphaeraceae bacterium]
MTRLWPMSRLGGPQASCSRSSAPPRTATRRSLLQLAAQRLDGLVPPPRRYICTGESYRDAIRRSLPEFSDDRILGEPVPRDTVNAVGFTAAVLQKLDPDAVFAVFTADHVIEPHDLFRQRVDLGFRLVEADPARLVTFSITPTYPATGFGYIERGGALPLPPGLPPGVGAPGVAFRVARYVEKPTIERATAYVKSGMFSWNSGMFVWKAATVMECIRRFKPESHAGLLRIQAAWGTPDQARVLAEVYPTLPRISVDYAIMEPASQPSEKQVSVCTVLTDVRWLDVGSWPSYGETLTPDADGNRLGGALAPDHAHIIAGRNNLAVSSDPRHTIALLGCDNLIVVHTPDATLVMPRDKAEELKAVHARLRDDLK